MTGDTKPTDWHDLLQTILEEHMPLMSGKTIIHKGREEPKTIHLDYYCQARKKPGADEPQELIFPFGHFKAYNVVEYKSAWESLNERRFRYYSSRALLVESDTRPGERQGKTTLTIIVSRKPVKLMKVAKYRIRELSSWHYVSDWIPDLEVHILNIAGMRGLAAGEPLAFLQVLEGNPVYRRQNWELVMGQDLTRPELLKRVIMKIDREACMSILEEEKRKGEKLGEAKGKAKGKADTLLSFLELVPPELYAKYQAAIKSAKNLTELTRLETQLKQQLRGA